MYIRYIGKCHKFIFHTHKVIVSDTSVTVARFTSVTVAGFYCVMSKHIVFTHLVVVR